MFKNAWNIGTISGIKLRLHWSFLIIPLLAGYSAFSSGQGIGGALFSVVLVLAVFGCVLLHELGHAFAARQFGIGTRDILLLPIGGVASLNYMPRNPFQELWIAVAGPLVNILIAVVLFLALLFSPLSAYPLLATFVQNLAIVNIALVVFNMIPAFPMDGGRVFRSFMAMFLEYEQATVIAATVGKYCAILLGLYGLFFGHFMLILLAAFVFFAGQAEKRHVLMSNRNFGWNFRFSPGGQPDATAHRNQSGFSEFDHGMTEISVPATLPGDSVAAWLKTMHAEYCSVVESGQIIGRITRAQLLQALSRGLGNLPVGQILTHR